MHSITLDASNSLLQKLMDVLDDIKDVEFVAVVCVETMLPDIGGIAALLNYANTRLTSNTQVRVVMQFEKKTFDLKKKKKNFFFFASLGEGKGC